MTERRKLPCLSTPSQTPTQHETVEQRTLHHDAASGGFTPCKAQVGGRLGLLLHAASLTDHGLQHPAPTRLADQLSMPRLYLLDLGARPATLDSAVCRLACNLGSCGKQHCHTCRLQMSFQTQIDSAAVTLQSCRRCCLPPSQESPPSGFIGLKLALPGWLERYQRLALCRLAQHRQAWTAHDMLGHAGRGGIHKGAVEGAGKQPGRDGHAVLVREAECEHSHKGAGIADSQGDLWQPLMSAS